MNSVTLKYPVTVGSKEYTSLSFRRPKAKDMLAADKVGGGARGLFATYASVADVEIAVIEELDYADYLAVQKVVEDILGNSQQEAGVEQ